MKISYKWLKLCFFVFLLALVPLEKLNSSLTCVMVNEYALIYLMILWLYSYYLFKNIVHKSLKAILLFVVILISFITIINSNYYLYIEDFSERVKCSIGNDYEKKEYVPYACSIKGVCYYINEDYGKECINQSECIGFCDLSQTGTDSKIETLKEEYRKYNNECQNNPDSNKKDCHREVTKENMQKIYEESEGRCSKYLYEGK